MGLADMATPLQTLRDKLNQEVQDKAQQRYNELKQGITNPTFNAAQQSLDQQVAAGPTPLPQDLTNPMQGHGLPLVGAPSTGGGLSSNLPTIMGMLGGAGGTSSGGGSTSTGGPSPGDYSNLLGQYGALKHVDGVTLQQDAMKSLQQLDKGLGVPLSTLVTPGSYRTYAQQAANYAKDPNRFAPPGKSLHEYGLAVDINMNVLQAHPNIRNYLLSHGWYAARSDEPWHFSYGVSG